MLLFRALYLFFGVVQCILMIYILCRWLPISQKVRSILVTLVIPILVPVRLLLRHSVYYTRQVDLAPLVALALIFFLQDLFYALGSV